MRFHLIDRVDSYEPRVSVKGRKVTSLSEDYWEETADGLVMPPPLVLEALCQAATWLVMISTDTRQRAALLSIGSVDFLVDVRPGDVVELEGTAESWGDETAVVSGRATVDGRVVLEAKDVMCTLIDSDTLEDTENTKRMQAMLDRAAAGAEV
jgi:3-hydroxyacyl-[acyl-carrier-protein] dehydratase